MLGEILYLLAPLYEQCLQKHKSWSCFTVIVVVQCSPFMARKMLLLIVLE